MPSLPRLATIRQTVPTAPLADVAQAVRDELARIDLRSRIKPGARIAVGAGSRGITDYALIVGTVVRELQALGAAPFIFPAMGSHGGATAEGQRGVLAEWGITPSAWAARSTARWRWCRSAQTPDRHRGLLRRQRLRRAMGSCSSTGSRSTPISTGRPRAG